MIEDRCPAFALGSFSIAGSAPFAGMVLGDRVIALAALDGNRLAGTLLDVLERWDDNIPRLEDAAMRWSTGDRGLSAIACPLSLLKASPPLRPRQIFATGANYRKHVIELLMGDPDARSDEIHAATTEDERRAAAERMMDERADNAVPYCFTKLPTAVAGPADPLVISAGLVKVDWECELAVVIGKSARHVSAEQASGHIAGYAIANDVTARELIFRQDIKALGTDWLSSKSQPGFLPFGPFVVPAAFVDPYELAIRLSVNGRVMQNERTSDMLISIDRQIEYLSSRVQLLPGDVVCTGSPAGNGSHYGIFLKPGDVMTASITGLGEQCVPCVAG